MSVRPDDDLIRELYARFGLAYYQSECLHRNLCIAFAWAGFGAAFGPLVILSLYWRKLTATGALAGMVAGAVTVFVWGSIDALHSVMYEIVPGFLLNLAVAIVVSNATFTQNAEVQQEFTAMEEELAAS